jgi:F-type H+-transporting ATPase subunit a
VNAAGEPIDGKALENKTVEFSYLDHHSLIKPKPRYTIHPVIGTIGKQTLNPGSKTETVTIDGAEVTLVNPTVTFAYASMFPELWVISMLTALGIALATFLMTRKLERIPSRKQTLLEILYTYFDGFVHGLIGDHYKRYLPLVGTIYIYVLMMNLAGIIPGWASPTANINVPAGIAIVVVLYVQFEGIRVNGLKGYLMHFVGDPWWLGPLNFPIHAVGEVARVLSLTIRLFGNIFGEDVVIVILIMLAGMFTKGWFPLQAPMYLLAIFTSFVQAMVFSILTCVYIALMTTHEEGHGHGHGHDEEHGVYHDGHAPAPAV